MALWRELLIWVFWSNDSESSANSRLARTFRFSLSCRAHYVTEIAYESIELEAERRWAIYIAFFSRDDVTVRLSFPHSFVNLLLIAFAVAFRSPLSSWRNALSKSIFEFFSHRVWRCVRREFEYVTIETNLSGAQSPNIYIRHSLEPRQRENLTRIPSKCQTFILKSFVRLFASSNNVRSDMTNENSSRILCIFIVGVVVQSPPNQSQAAQPPKGTWDSGNNLRMTNAKFIVARVLIKLDSFRLEIAFNYLCLCHWAGVVPWQKTECRSVLLCAWRGETYRKRKLN